MKNIREFRIILSVICFLYSSCPLFSEVSHSLEKTNLRALKGSELIIKINSKMHSLGMSAQPKTNNLRKYPFCSDNLKISPIFGSWKTVQISCEAKEDWETNIRTNLIEVENETKLDDISYMTNIKKKILKPSIMVVVASTDLKFGETIHEDDVSLVETKKFFSESYFTSITNVIGRKLKTSIKEGKILKDRNLLPDWVVVKEQPIIIEAKNTGFSVYADGIALSNGYLGDLIKVRNTGSGLEFLAWVASGKKVHPLANINNE